MLIIVTPLLPAPVIAIALQLIHAFNVHIGGSATLAMRAVRAVAWWSSPIVTAIVVTSVAAVLGALVKRHVADRHPAASSQPERHL